jgi:hypothetical protein
MMHRLFKNGFRIFKLCEITIRRGLSRKKKNKEKKRIRAIIHIYMEMSQGNSLQSYVKQTKISFFLQKQRTGRQNRYLSGGVGGVRG